MRVLAQCALDLRFRKQFRIKKNYILSSMMYDTMMIGICSASIGWPVCLFVCLSVSLLSFPPLSISVSLSQQT